MLTAREPRFKESSSIKKLIMRMSITYFLLSFFLIYSGFHFYLFFKIRGAFHPNAAAIICITIVFILLGLAPILIRVTERYGFEITARLFAYIGYIWMGFIVLFFFTSIILDLYRLLIYIVAHATRADMSALRPSPFYAFIIPFFIALGITVYGYFEAINIRTENITINTPKLPPEAGRIRIAQISDIHIGLIVKEKRLQRILAEVKKTDPDIIVSTGDLLDGESNNLVKTKELLKSINARHGKYAVTGNHEFFAGIEKAVDFTEGAGFRLLRGEGITVAGLINMVGIDDSTGRNIFFPRRVPEKDILAKLPREHFTLLLKHRPVVNPDASGHFDLQLSGHTHKGQLFPFSIITGLFFPYHAGFYDLPDGSSLYVNRGSGTWGPPIRFLSPPEITIIDLIPGK
jgi:predicted MPP superfamily phosphohydrolase